MNKERTIAALKNAGHSTAKALEIFLDATRGDQYAITRIDIAVGALREDGA